MTEPKLIPEQFTAQSNSISSYNYTDIAEGTGITVFKGFAMTYSTGVSYGLNQNSFYARPIETTCSSGAGSTERTVNFDLAPFNLPKTVKGTAYVEGSWALNTSAGNTMNGYITFTVQKWNGSTAVDAGSVVTETVSAGSAQTKINTLLMPINLTQTHFKIGEILRLNVILRAINTGGSGGDNMLAHDPKNRNGTIITPSSTYHTDLIFYCPFKLTEIGY